MWRKRNMPDQVLQQVLRSKRSHHPAQKTLQFRLHHSWRDSVFMNNCHWIEGETGKKGKIGTRTEPNEAKVIVQDDWYGSKEHQYDGDKCPWSCLVLVCEAILNIMSCNVVSIVMEREVYMRCKINDELASKRQQRRLVYTPRFWKTNLGGHDINNEL